MRVRARAVGTERSSCVGSARPCLGPGGSLTRDALPGSPDWWVWPDLYFSCTRIFHFFPWFLAPDKVENRIQWPYC